VTSTGAGVTGTDYNGDGRSDIVLTGGTGWNTIPVALSQGNGSFSTTNIAVGGSFGSFAAVPGVRVVATSSTTPN
jgi:hypothetical protein